MTHTHRLLVAALLFLLPAVATAGETRGVIAEVNLARKQLVVDARGIGIRGTLMVFTLGDNVAVTVGQQPARLTDLTPGKRVRVTYDVRNNQLVVTGIHSVDLGGLLQGVQQVIPALTSQQKSAPPPPAPPGEAGVQAQVAPAELPAAGLTGTLRRSAPTEREIIVATQGPAGEQYAVFAVPDNARILRDGQPIAMEALRAEEPVVVRGAKRNGKLTAVTVQVGQVAQVAPEAAPPAAGNLPMPGQPPAAPSRIGQIRRVLQIADGVLEMIEKQREGK